MFRSGNATLLISKEEMNDMKIVKTLEESGLLIKVVSETKTKQKNKIGQF